MPLAVSVTAGPRAIRTPSAPPQRVAIYIRVSSTEQAEGYSLATQEEHCRSYCDERGYQLVAEPFTDVYTGAQYRERPGLSGLRQLVRDGAVDVILAHALDRLSRNQAHLYVLAEEAEDHGARLEFITENFEDSAVGRFIRSAKAFAAEVEREKLTERVIRGRKARIASGKLASRPKALYGYTFTDNARGCYVLNDAEAQIVRCIFTECLAGRPINQIRISHNDDGVPSPSGKPYWAHTTIHRTLTNQAYTGQAVAWHGEFALPDGVIPPLVTKEEFEAVGDRLKHNKQFALRNTLRPEHALLRGGYVKCGHCGRTVQVVRNLDRALYRCYRADEKAGYCPGSAMLASLLDKPVWDRVTAILSDETLIERELERLMREDPTAADEEAIERARKGLSKQETNLTRALAMVEDSAAMAPIVQELQQIAERRAELDAEYERIRTQRAR